MGDESMKATTVIKGSMKGMGIGEQWSLQVGEFFVTLHPVRNAQNI